MGRAGTVGRWAVLVAAASLAASGVLPAPARAQAPLTGIPQTPYSVFTHPSATPIDGIATWVWVLRAPEIGEQSQFYFYGMGFGFTNSTATGWVTINASSSAKGVYAIFTGPDGIPRGWQEPFFNWKVGHPYLLYLRGLGSGMWQVLLYDLTDKVMWTGSSFALPAEWGSISPASLTGMWMGRVADACSSYRPTDALIYKPIPFSGGTPLAATRAADLKSGGDCLSTTAVQPDGWTRYGFRV